MIDPNQLAKTLSQFDQPQADPESIQATYDTFRASGKLMSHLGLKVKMFKLLLAICTSDSELEGMLRSYYLAGVSHGIEIGQAMLLNEALAGLNRQN